MPRPEFCNTEPRELFPTSGRARLLRRVDGCFSWLTGLLFVAISINLEQILKFPNLSGRAAGSPGILVRTLVVASFGLALGQGARTLGVEIAAAGSLVVFQPVRITARQRAHKTDQFSWRLERALH